MTALGNTSRQILITSRVLSHQYVMIDEIQISSGSGKTVASMSDSSAARAFVWIARRRLRSSSGGRPKQHSTFSSSAGLNPAHFGGTYSTVEQSFRTFSIFLG